MEKRPNEDEYSGYNSDEDDLATAAKRRRVSILADAARTTPPFEFRSTKNQKVQADVGGVAKPKNPRYRRYVNRTKARSTVEEV